jgi:hypothetical protein
MIPGVQKLTASLLQASRPKRLKSRQPTHTTLLLPRLFDANPHLWLDVILNIACQRAIGKRFAAELVLKVLFETRGFVHPLARALTCDLKFNHFVRGTHHRLLVVRVAGSCTCGGPYGIPTWKQPVDDAAKYLTAQNQGKRLPLTKQIVCHLGRVGRVPQHLISAGHGHGARHYHNGIYCDARMRLSVTTSCSMARLWTQYAKNHYNRELVHYHHMFREHESEFSEVDYLHGASREQVREMIGRAHGIRGPSVIGEDFVSRAKWVQTYYNSLRSPEEQLEDWPRRN